MSVLTGSRALHLDTNSGFLVFTIDMLARWRGRKIPAGLECVSLHGSSAAITSNAAKHTDREVVKGFAEEIVSSSRNLLHNLLSVPHPPGSQLRATA